MATELSVATHLFPLCHATNCPASVKSTASMTARTARLRPKLSPGDSDQLIADHAGMIRAIAFSLKKQLPSSIDVNDLIQDGYVALLSALLRTTTEAVRLQSKLYIAQRIRGAMLDGLRMNDPGSRLARSRMRRATEAIQSLGHKLGRAPDEGEVAESLGMPVAEYQRLLAHAHRFSLLSIEDLNDGGSTDDFIERCASQDADPAAVLERRQLQRELLLAISCLTEREERIMSLLYIRNMTLRLVGEELGLSEGRISQIHSGIVARLRDAVLRDGKAVLKPRRRTS